jgi:hypothetical protein
MILPIDRHPGRTVYSLYEEQWVAVVAQVRHDCLVAIVPLRLYQSESILSWQIESNPSGALALVEYSHTSENSIHLAWCAWSGMLDRFFLYMASRTLVFTLITIFSDFDHHGH